MHYYFVESMNRPESDPIAFWTNGSSFSLSLSRISCSMEVALVVPVYWDSSVSKVHFVQIVI
jgi:hypothetical protein